MFEYFAERLDRLEEAGEKIIGPKAYAVNKALCCIGSVIDAGVKSWINSGSGNIESVAYDDIEPSRKVQAFFGVGILAVAAVSIVEVKTNIDLNPIVFSMKTTRSL
jgi:hypothetical protein